MRLPVLLEQAQKGYSFCYIYFFVTTDLIYLKYLLSQANPIFWFEIIFGRIWSDVLMVTRSKFYTFLWHLRHLTFSTKLVGVWSACVLTGACGCLWYVWLVSYTVNSHGDFFWFLVECIPFFCNLMGDVEKGLQKI